MRGPQWMMILLALAMACGSTRDAGSLPANLMAFCSSAQQAFCSANLACCSKQDERYADVQTCVANDRGLEQCVQQASGSALRDGRVRFESTAAEQLLSELSRAAQSCRELVDPEAIRRVLVGSQTEGADCSSTNADPSPFFSCAPDFFCSSYDPQSVDAAGDAMKRPHPICTKRGAASEACVIGELTACAPGLGCSASSRSMVGRCQALITVGSVCTSSEACASSSCVSGACSDAGPSNDYCARDTMPGNWCDSGGGGSLGIGACFASWSACKDGASYRVECESGGGSLSCSCSKDTVVGATFNSSGFCSADDATQVAAARTGCGWDIRF
jgi:hypothetical protein